MPPFASFTLYNAPEAGWLTGDTQIQDKRIPVFVFGDSQLMVSFGTRIS
jgi:hypothetical protein